MYQGEVNRAPYHDKKLDCRRNCGRKRESYGVDCKCLRELDVIWIVSKEDVYTRMIVKSGTCPMMPMITIMMIMKD